MNRIFSSLFLGLFALTFVSGCAHSHPRGSVVYKDSPKEGHICIGHDEVKPGDIVNVYKSVCTQREDLRGSRGGPITRTRCEKTLVGEGKIVEFSDQHFARMEALGDLNLEQGLIVEKKIN